MATHAHSTPVPAHHRGLLRAFAHPLADPESTAVQSWNASGLASEEALASTASRGLLPDAEARTIHMRRRLGEALEFGFALLDALDLPPLTLDVIDDAIAALDALDAASEDLEDDDPAEETSLETAGLGFVRCGADDAEEDDGCERGEEHGSDDAEDIGHHASQYRPRPLTRAQRAEVAVIAARAATLRRALHV